MTDATLAVATGPAGAEAGLLATPAARPKSNGKAPAFMLTADTPPASPHDGASLPRPAGPESDIDAEIDADVADPTAGLELASAIGSPLLTLITVTEPSMAAMPAVLGRPEAAGTAQVPAAPLADPAAASDGEAVAAALLLPETRVVTATPALQLPSRMSAGPVLSANALLVAPAPLATAGEQLPPVGQPAIPVGSAPADAAATASVALAHSGQAVSHATLAQLQGSQRLSGALTAPVMDATATEMATAIDGQSPGNEAGSQSESGHAPQDFTSLLLPRSSEGSTGQTMAPFRIDASPWLARPDGALVAGQPLPAAAPTAPTILPDIDAESAFTTPDVVVRLVDGGRLDVTISTTDSASHRRLDQAQPQLVQALNRLGSEVEAIRVELRPPSGPDNQAAVDTGASRQEAGAGSGAGAGQSAFQASRYGAGQDADSQGHGRDRQDRQDDRANGRIAASAGVSRRSGHVDARPGARRVDLYA